MNKVVTKLLASELPASLRGSIAGDHLVEVTVTDVGAAPAEADALAQWKDLMAHRPRGLNVSTEEAVARIRKLRDEWDDRA